MVAAQAVLLPKRILTVDITRDPPWRARLRENTPDGRIDAPILLAQGANDPIVSPVVQARWVAARCAAGRRIDFRRYPRGHVDIMASAGSDLLAWTQRRFAGAPAPSACRVG